MGWLVNTTPLPLCPRVRHDAHCVGGWVGPRAALDRRGKSRPPPGFGPRTVQPVATTLPRPTMSVDIIIIFLHYF